MDGLYVIDICTLFPYVGLGRETEPLSDTPPYQDLYDVHIGTLNGVISDM